MILDMTVTLGNLLTIVGFILSGMMAFLAMRSDLRILNMQVESLDKRLQQLGNVVRDLAIQDQRISVIEEQIEDLRHGRGYVIARRVTRDKGSL